MFTKEQLEGIIISLANPEIAIEKDRHHSIGYKIILRVHFRVKNKDYLLELQETLRANGIDSYLKDEEKKFEGDYSVETIEAEHQLGEKK